MSYETPMPPSEEPRSKVKVYGGIGAAVAVILIVLGIVVATQSSTRKNSASGVAATGDATAGTAPGGKGGAGAGASSSASAGAGVHIGSTAAAKAVSTVLRHPDIHLAPAANRSDAASVLTADDSHYRRELATGEGLVGKSGFAAWASQTLGDNQDQADFAKAHGEFTPSDQPPALDTWHADNDAAVAALQQFAKDAASGSTVASRTDAADATTDLADADQIAQQVDAGK